MKKLTLILLSFISIPLFAQTKPFTDKLNGFTIGGPTDWSADTKKSSFKVFFQNEDETGSIGVMIHKLKTKVTALDFLNAVEKEMNVKNIMDEGERPLAQAILDQVGAESGAMGVFMKGEEGAQVRQMMFIFGKNLKTYTVLITFPEEDKEDYRQLIKDVLNTFRIL